MSDHARPELIPQAQRLRPPLNSAMPLISPGEQGLAAMIAGQAAASPDALAVACAGQVITYRELDQRSSQLAQQLAAMGVQPEVLVAVCLPRSIAMVVAALAVLKTGGAYLPLDPSYPAARIDSIMAAADVAVLITNQCQRLASGPWKVIPPDAGSTTPASAVGLNPPVAGDNLAYVIFTSGTTGQPKGVEITQRSLMNLVRWHRRAFSVTAQDRAIQISSPGFDAAVWELWPYLTAGASIHIVDDQIRLAPGALRDWLVQQRITIAFVPTPLAERLITLDWPFETALRVLLTGADALHHYPPAGLPFMLVNNYGPTECTVVATSGVVPPGENPESMPTIGKPIDSTYIYVLDEMRRRVPLGGEGELYVGGAGIARGYRNRPDLTSERFIPDPFNGAAGRRLYRTGDLGRWLPNGEIAFLGRVDEQIKIRGFRIEPSAIVSVLLGHSAVQECAVIAREDIPGEKVLVAYVVSAPGVPFSSHTLRDFVAERLPAHMVPAIFAPIQSLPLTPNGKIDRAALPPPAELESNESVFIAPQTLCQERLSAIVAPLLNLPRVSMHDNFFMLGGHSLLGAQLIARIRSSFGVDLPLRSLFDNPTIAELAADIEQRILSKLEAVAETERRGCSAS